jgi:hypothetical protein
LLSNVSELSNNLCKTKQKLLIKYIGENYKAKSVMIDVNSVKTGGIITFCFEFLSDNWKTVKKDGVDTIICSIEKNSVLKDHFWLVCKLNSPK